MPRREGVDALGLPIIAPASRSRPGSSNAMYTQGGTGFAGSSSSLVNTGMRGPAATSEPNLAAFIPQSPGPGHGPVSATDAPHLSTTESFFGRMTLTAPDNMRRKKAEEREKKKQVRRKRAERGAIAAASLANPPEIGPSHPPAAAGAVPSGLAAAAESSSTSRRRKRPVLSTSNSGSNLHIHTLEQSRSRSPTRPVRSQSGQSSQDASRQASPERRLRRRARGGSDASAVESGTAAAPTYQHAGESAPMNTAQDAQPTSQELASLPTAAQQRRDIYADLDTLGLPGADEADLEDQPPPFPAYATRPISPPQRPAEGQEWTDEMRRRQEEYEMNRPPDSPPPAFRSDDETRAAREGSEQFSSSDEESNAGEIARERQEWEDDAAAGFSLEERIERDRLRREAREGPIVDEEAVPRLASPRVIPTEPEEMPVEEPFLAANEAVDKVIAVPEVSPSAIAMQPEDTIEQEPTQQVKAEPAEEQQAVQGSPSAPLNLGQLVMEARARRASEAKKKAEEFIKRSKPSEQFLQDTVRFGVRDVTPADRALFELMQLGAALPSQSETSRLLQEIASQPLRMAASQSSSDAAEVPEEVAVAARPQDPVPAAKPLRHRKVASEGNAEQSTLTPKAAPLAKSKMVPATSAGMAKEEGRSIRPVKARPRPSGESHTRFRDGASAAANRRMALWGPTARPPAVVATPGDRDQSVANSSLGAVDVKMEEDGVVPSQLVRQVSSPSKSAADSAPESEEEASSDSDGKWEKEEAAFQALQRRLEPPASVEGDSSDEEATDQNAAQRPGWFRSNSMDLAKPGSSVPRAPPPLVLGRSRGGGAEYSSSSESSSESGANRMDDDSDDSLSPVEIEEVSSQGRPSFSTSDRPSVKGKEPVRPSFESVDRKVPGTMVPSVRPRAGHFEEDSGSSHDFASDEGEQGHMEERQSDGTMRPPVGNRLKTLFFMPLGDSSQTSAVLPLTAHRANAASLFDKQIAAPPSLAMRRSTQSSTTEAGPAPTLTRQPSDKSLRAREWANAYATLEAKQQRDLNSEQQIRLEALEQISRLQIAGGGSSESTSSINHDSLDALERLLSRRSYVPSTPATAQADEDRRATLRRSGAINRPSVAAPFVNPRSSIAPRPLGRLPTITNATRHFPPSRQATEEPSNSPSPTVSSITPRNRRSVVEPANWMTYIPEGERHRLPEPLEPVKKRREISPTGPPPPLPMRSSVNRVSAMVERFEGQSAEGNSSVLPPRSPSLPTASEVARDDSLRRRPPPPPPRLAQQQPSRPVSASMSTIPPSSPFLPSSSSQGEGLGSLPVKPFKPPFLRDHTSPQIPATSTFTAPALSQSPPLPLSRASEPRDPPSVASRTRARPLPIPPIFKPVTASSIEIPQQQSQDNSPDEENEEDSDNDEDSASPQPESSSTSSHPASAAARGPAREASLGYTDLDLFASRLADEAPADGTNYEDLHLLAEFLGPAKSTGATAEEVEALSVGVIEVLRKRIVGKRANGKDKIKVSLQLMGVKVERCGVCLLQFKEGNLACLFPCLHVLHEDCATKLLRNIKNCPVCRQSIN